MGIRPKKTSRSKSKAFSNNSQTLTNKTLDEALERINEELAEASRQAMITGQGVVKIDAGNASFDKYEVSKEKEEKNDLYCSCSIKATKFVEIAGEAVKVCTKSEGGCGKEITDKKKKDDWEFPELPLVWDLGDDIDIPF